MRYIEPHAHMVSRTTDDYEKLVTAGCEAICEPAFWAGFDRGSVEGFRDYYLQLTQYEPARAAKFGIPHFTWICLNPKESEDLSLAKDVLEIIPEFLDKPIVFGEANRMLLNMVNYNTSWIYFRVITQCINNELSTLELVF